MAINQQSDNQGWTDITEQPQPVTTGADAWVDVTAPAPSARPAATPAPTATPQLPAFQPAEQTPAPVTTPAPVWSEGGIPVEQGPQTQLAPTPKLSMTERLFERWYDTPSQGFMGAAAAKVYDWMDYGHSALKRKYPNKTDAEIELLADRTIAQVRKNMLQEIEARQSADPAWRPDQTFMENLLSVERWVPALTGTVFGSASPVDFVAPGAGSLTTRAATAFGVNAAEDLATQGLDISSGVQDEYSGMQTAAAGVLGAGFQGAIELPGAVYRDIMGPGQVRPTLSDKVNAGGVKEEPLPGEGISFTVTDDSQVIRDFETESAIADMVEQGASTEQVMQAFPDYYAANPDAPAITQQWVEYKAAGGEEPMRFRDNVDETELFEKAFSDIMDEAGLPGVSSGRPIGAPVARKAPAAEEGMPVPSLGGRVDAETPPLKPRQQEIYDKVLDTTKNWVDTPVFEVVDSVDDLPAPIRNAVYADGAEGAPAFVGSDGKVRLIASNIKNDEDLNAIVFHEMLGHKGLQKLFGDELDNMLNGLLQNAPDFLAQAQAWVARETDLETGRKPYGGDLTRAAEEVLAEMSEAGQIKPSLMQKLRAIVEQLARKAGIKKTFSDNDIRMIMANAHRTIVDGKGGRGKNSDSIKGMRYMTGWHGSPHDFDKFLTQFMGTGEGAQAFGWGLYFAEDRAVAENYRETLTFGKSGPVFKIGDKQTQGVSGILMAIEDAFEKRHPEAYNAEIWLHSLADFIRYRGRAPLVADELISYGETTFALAASSPSPTNQWIREGLESSERFRNVDMLLDLIHELGVEKQKGGRLYEVELPDDGVWIDLDKSVRDQDPAVKEALKAMGWEPDFIVSSAKTFVLEKLPRKYGNPKNVSQTLRMYGITGNKFLDGKSRMKGEGTRNYVVFDDADVKVVNKYMRRAPGDRDNKTVNDIQYQTVVKGVKKTKEVMREFQTFFKQVRKTLDEKLLNESVDFQTNSFNALVEAWEGVMDFVAGVERGIDDINIGGILSEGGLDYRIEPLLESIREEAQKLKDDAEVVFGNVALPKGSNDNAPTPFKESKRVGKKAFRNRYGETTSFVQDINQTLESLGVKFEEGVGEVWEGLYDNDNRYMRTAPSERAEPGGITSAGFRIPKPDSRMQARDREMRREVASQYDPFAPPEQQPIKYSRKKGRDDKPNWEEIERQKTAIGGPRDIDNRNQGTPRANAKGGKTNFYIDRGQPDNRAGNLNLSRIATGPDVKKYLQEVASNYPTKRTTREEIRDLAKELNMSAAEVKNLSKRIVRAEEVYAARETVLRSAEETEDLARRYVKGELNDREKVQFGLKAARHAAIQEALMDIAGEAGRVLNIFNETVRTSDTGDIQYMLRGMPNDMLRSPEFLDELASKIARNPLKTHKITREAFKPTASDYFWSLWYNMMLSRPTTHIANIAGTLMNTVLSLATYGGASIIGQTRRFNETRRIDLETGYRLLERSEQIRASVRERGITPELNKSAIKQADEMRARALAIIDANDRVSAREVAARLFGAVAGIKAGFVNAPKAFVLGMPLHRVSRVEHQTAILPGPLTALETPVRFMAATDEFFRNIIQLSDYYGQAMRRAVGEGRKGKAMIDRVTQLVDNPTKDMLDSAANYAQVIQFLDDPSGVGRKIEQLRTNKPADSTFTRVGRGTLRLFIPFIRSPDSLIRTAIRYSPIGAFGTERYNLSDAAAGGGRKDLARTRVAMGSMLALYIAYMAEQGQISGEGPSDYRKREELESTGWRPNSILVDGQWISYQGFEPVSIPINVVATTAERVKEADAKASEKGGYVDPTRQNFENAFAGILGLSEALTNNTWTESLHDVITLTQGSAGKGNSMAENAVAGIAATAVPAIVRGYTQDVVDPTRRLTTGDSSMEDRVIGRLQAAIPGQSETLPAARDVFGREIVREGSPEIPFIGQTASNFINRSKKSTVSTDPVDVELDRLTKGQVGTVIGLPSKNNIKTWEGERDLTAEEFSEYARIAGQNLYYWMSEYIQTPEYKNMSDAEKIKAIQKERNRVRKLTREMLFGTPEKPPVDLSQEWQEVEP